MKLLAPINTFESCIAQVNAGANELYVGLHVDFLGSLHFSARGQAQNAEFKIMPSEKELKKIVDYAHDCGVIVNLTANTTYINDRSINTINLEEFYIKYVMTGLSCNVDNIIVADIGLIYLLGNMELPVSIHASTILDTLSLSQLCFLKELNVKRTVLSYQISYDEIKEICKNKPMEIEIFGYGGCSFGGCCNLGHGLSMGIACKNQYCTERYNEKKSILDFTRGCCLCSLWDFNNMDVDTIKIVGREFNYQQTEPIVKVFAMAMDLSKKTSELEYIKEIQKLIPSWWRRAICKKIQCKYQKDSELYYI